MVKDTKTVPTINKQPDHEHPEFEIMKLKTTWGVKILTIVTIFHHMVWTLAGILLSLVFVLVISILPGLIKGAGGQGQPTDQQRACIEGKVGKDRAQQLFAGQQPTPEEKAKIEACQSPQGGGQNPTPQQPGPQQRGV